MLTLFKFIELDHSPFFKQYGISITLDVNMFPLCVGYSRRVYQLPVQLPAGPAGQPAFRHSTGEYRVTGKPNRGGHTL